MEDAVEELPLEAPSQGGPVLSRGLEPLDDHLLAARGVDEPGVALLAALGGAPHRRHQEAHEVSLELDLEGALDPMAPLQRLAPVGVEVGGERAPGRFALARVSGVDMHEERVGVAVDHREAALFDPPAALGDDLVAAQGDRAGELRAEEATARRAQHAVEGVHQDLDRLGAGRVVSLLRLVAGLPQVLDQLG